MSNPRRRQLPRHLLGRLQTVLEGYRGAARVIRARDLAIVLGLHDPTGRTVRELVNELIGMGIPIGSTNFESGGGGYFYVVTASELDHCVRNYRSRARQILLKAELLEEAFRRGPRQPALLDEPEATGAPTA